MRIVGTMAVAMLLVAGLPAAKAQHTEHDAHGGHATQAPPGDHAGHDMESGDGSHAGHKPENAATAKPMPIRKNGIPRGMPPAPPSDHAADLYYDPAEMARARRLLAHENGGMPVSLFKVDQLERRFAEGGDGLRWKAEGFMGGDINRFAFKTEGEGKWSGPLEQAEVQAFYSRAIGPYFNVHAGVRHDIRPSPQRSYAVIGIGGLAPYWFEVETQLFLSDKGDAHARIEASYDQRITQSLILEPEIELDFAAQDVPEIGIGSGLSKAEAGLRLRYEIVREFAPYVGVTWERKFGGTARYARLEGENPSATALVAGLRFWF